jgi:DNA-directed RNA polymerase subunit RPC12/RpoP
MADELITLRTYGSLPEALLVKGELDSAGIDCELVDDNVARALGSVLPGGVKLRVAKEDEAEARAILGEGVPPSLNDEESGLHYTQPRCPNCHSLQVSTNDEAAPTPGLDDLKCDDCGHRWQQKEDAE